MSHGTRSNVAGKIGARLAADAPAVASVGTAEVHYRDLAVIEAATDEGAVVPAVAKTPSKLRSATQSQQQTGAGNNAEIVELRSNVLDALSLLTAMEADVASRIRAVSSRADAANGSLFSSVKSFDDGFIVTNFQGFGEARLLREMNAQVDAEFADAFGRRVVVPDSSAYLSVLDDLSKTLIKPGPAWTAYLERIRSRVTQPLMPLGDRSLPSLLLSVNRFAHTDVLADAKAEAQRVNAAAEALRQQLAAELEKEKIVKSTAGDDFAEIKRADAVVTDVVSAIVQVHDSAVQALCGSGAGAGHGGIASQLLAILNGDAIELSTNEKKALQDRIAHDIDAIDKLRVEKHRENEARTATYEATTAKSLNRLREVFNEQQTCWRDIQERIERLGDLMNGAKNETLSHLDATEAEQRRRKEYREFKESYGTHRAYLEDLKCNTATAIDFLANSQRFFEEEKRKIEQSNVEADLHQLVAAQLTSLTGVFQQLRARRLDQQRRSTFQVRAADHMLHEANLQRQVAVLSCDPEALQWGASREALSKRAVTHQMTIDAIDAMLDQESAQFDATLLTAGAVLSHHPFGSVARQGAAVWLASDVLQQVSSGAAGQTKGALPRSHVRPPGGAPSPPHNIASTKATIDFFADLGQLAAESQATSDKLKAVLQSEGEAYGGTPGSSDSPARLKGTIRVRQAAATSPTIAS